MKRYYKVTSNQSSTVHIKREDNRSEGVTKCGRYIGTGWLWSVDDSRSVEFMKPYCKQCYR